MILDEEAAEMLDEQVCKASEGGASRFFFTAKASKSEREARLHETGLHETITDDGRDTPIDNPYLRGKTLRLNTHPTVKPLALMRYLLKLIVPPGGLVLDPFMGSGSTLIACQQLGIRGIGVEIEEKYAEIAAKRLHLRQEVFSFEESQPKRELRQLDVLLKSGHPDQEGIKKGIEDWLIQDAIEEEKRKGAL